MSARKIHVLIVEGRFYAHISDMLLEGAKAALEAEGASYEVVTAPGALEIPPLIAMAGQTNNYDAYIALGCVIRGETSHYDVVAGESARGIMELGTRERLCIGNGILTCENEEQAVRRADPKQKNKGRDAALAALKLAEFDYRMKS